MDFVFLGVVEAVILVVAFILGSRWGYRTFVSDLEMSIPSDYAVRGDPRSEICPRFAVGQLNRSGMPYPVRLFIDDGNLYVRFRGRGASFWGYPSYVIPRSEIVSADMGQGDASLRLGGRTIIFRKYSGLDLSAVLASGPSGLDKAEAERLIHPPSAEDASHIGHIFNPLRVLAGIVLLVFGMSAVASGHWEVLLGFAIGGGLVLGLLGRVVAQGTANPSQNETFSKVSLGTLVIVGLTSVLPLAVVGGAILALDDGPFFLVLGGAVLAASFSLFTIYIGLAASKVQAGRRKDSAPAS